jgi:hypothetical protein
VRVINYIWYCIETNELVLSNRKKWPQSPRTKLILLSDNHEYWRGLDFITSTDFIYLGDL